MLSGASTMLSLAGGTAKLVGGWAAARTGSVGILPWAGVATACAGGVFWLAVSPVRSDEATADATAVAAD